jgi:hypothetical protein
MTLDLTEVLIVLENIYNIGLLTLIPLVVVLIMSFRKIAAFPTIMVGALVGGLTATNTGGRPILSYSTRLAGRSTPLLHLSGACEKCNKYVFYGDSIHLFASWRDQIWQKVFRLPGD